VTVETRLVVLPVGWGVGRITCYWPYKEEDDENKPGSVYHANLEIRLKLDHNIEAKHQSLERQILETLIHYSLGTDLIGGGGEDLE